MKKIPVWKNVVLVFSALVIVIIATFAWFYTGPLTDADNVALEVGKASYVQISGDKGNSWSEDLNMEIGINKNFKEISGNGSVLYAPVYDVVENASGGFSTEIVAFEKVNGSEFHYEQTMDFRTDKIQNIYLSPESYVTSVDDGNDRYIDGAIRVAFFEIDESGNEELMFVWAPNSMVEFSSESDSFIREGSVEKFYYYQKSIESTDVAALEETDSDVAMIPTDNTDEFGCGYNEEYQFMWSNGQKLPADAPSVLTLDEMGNDNHYYKKLKVKVWLEGYDRECVSLLSGQKFTMKLKFDAQEVE